MHIQMCMYLYECVKITRCKTHADMASSLMSHDSVNVILAESCYDPLSLLPLLFNISFIVTLLFCV